MKKASIALALLASWVLVPAAFANTITVSTSSVATDTAGEAVAASAKITTGAGTVSITLSDNLTASQVLSVGQNLSALSFTLAGVTSAGSVTSSSGTFINVGSGGVVSPASGLAAPNTIGWGFGNSGDVYTLNGLGGLATPENTIIGGIAGSLAPYSGANASIDGNDPHNPFVQGTGMWVLSISGVTSSTDISNVIFSFGTTPGDSIPAPEPGTVLLLLVGLGALLTVSVVRRNKLLTHA